MPNQEPVKKAHLTTSNIKYLIGLWELGAADKGVRSIELAKRMDTSKPSTHAMVLNLCEKGLAVKDKNAQLHLTAEGAELAQQYARCYSSVTNRLEYFLKLTHADCRDAACSILAQVQERLPEFEAALPELQ